MTKAVVEGVRVAGIRAVVPKQRHSFIETPEPFTKEEAERLFASTGVYERRIAPLHICASDLCLCAAENLLKQLDWDPASIDILVFVTQDADYNVPATSCVMQRRLGMGTGAACFDMNLGCSGFIYGMWTVSRLLGGSDAKRALLLCGDTSARHLIPDDRSTRPLFGDAGAAAALERDDGASPTRFVLGTDGTGAGNILVKAGGRRNDLTPGLVPRTPEEDAALFNDARLYLNGAEIFSFTLGVVPRLMRETLAFAGLGVEAIDHCVPHQANAFMLEHLRRKGGFSKDQFLIDMRDFGNTSSASIPLAIAHRLGDSLSSGTRKLMMLGFGVGWSWGSMVADVGPIPAPAVDELPDDFEVLSL